MTKEEILKLKGRLLEEKADLEASLKTFAKKDRAPVGDWDTKFPQMEDRTAHQEENADEVEEYEKLLDAEHNFELRLQEIESALIRIENGDYGRCVKCGKEIARERLEANPAAATCVNH